MGILVDRVQNNDISLKNYLAVVLNASSTFSHHLHCHHSH
jgi:hypothetical protein